VCDDEIKDDESIYSIIETDEIENNEQEYDSSNNDIDFIDELARLTIETMNEVSCNHDWIRGKGDSNIKCIFCIYYLSQENRVTCNLCLKQACVECLKTKSQNWRKEVELESDERIISHHVRTLENRLNKLEIELEDLKNKVECDCISEGKNLQNIECQEQSIAVFENKNDNIIQLKDAITNFESKYIVKLPFKDILGIRIPIKIKLTSHITYKLLALVDISCTKNIIHDKYFIKCPELVHTIDDRMAETSTDMSGI
jgi:hypothetical protein